MLKITCECQEEIIIPVSKLGKKIQCPKCKKVDTVLLNSGQSCFLAIGFMTCILIAISKGFVAGLTALVIAAVSFALYVAIQQVKGILKNEEAKEKRIIETIENEEAVARERIRSDFTPPPECPKCDEDNWELLATSPNYKSARWKCAYCNKKVTIKQNDHGVEKRESGRAIPKNVQTNVWRRDQGQCVECGSKENIEFDHIIPWSKGGGNTTRNIQLLCQECNRKKSHKEPGTW